MTLACGTDNRDVDDDGWQTRINSRGECEWTPPPDLDHGQSRINYYHRPEALLRPPEDEALPIRNHRTKRHNDADFNPWERIPPKHPADPNHPTTKPPDSHTQLARRPSRGCAPGSAARRRPGRRATAVAAA